MIKQHCDICDCVIPNLEAYRTIHFGRGTNSNIDVGQDPMVICKRCWKKMLCSVKPEAYIENPEKLIPTNTDDVLGEIVNALRPKCTLSVDENGNGCPNCLHRDDSLDSDVCRNCIGLCNWEARDEKDGV